MQSNNNTNPSTAPPCAKSLVGNNFISYTTTRLTVQNEPSSEFYGASFEEYT